MNRRPTRIPIAVILLAGLVASVPAASAQHATPSLRLLAARRTVTLEPYRGRVRLDLGVYAASVGGAFELRVSRAGYDVAPSGVQVDTVSGEIVRSLPADLLDGFKGLPGFTRVVFRDEQGEVVAQRRLRFCPNGWERQRVSDQGPPVSGYPEFCTTWFPFLRGMVWGIDQAWASDALSAGGYREPKMRVAPGRYSVSVAITRSYRQLFGIAREDARVNLDVTVEDGGDGHRARDPRSPLPPLGPETRVPTIVEPDPATLPDLAALPAWSIGVSSSRRGDSLGFAASPWNAGPGPLVIEGFRRPDSDVMDAFQYFYDRDGNAVGRAPVGTLRYDRKDSHQHWHFLQFARFRLLDATSNEVVRSRKQAYCLLPTDAVDLTVDGADLSPWGAGLDLFSACGGESAIWVREALEAGWADTYFQGGLRFGFDITEVPNGRYYVEVAVNPDAALLEASTENNSVKRLVRLRVGPGERRVRVAPWQGVDA